MTNEELKNKILSLVRGAMLEADELPFIEATENITDALIAAEIGDVKEAEHRAEVYYEALLSAAAYGDTPPEYYIQQAEKELAEEKKE